MTTIQILGPRCTNCDRLEKLARKAIEQLHIDAKVLKISDPGQYIKYNVAATPGLVIDGKTVASGRVPSTAEIVAFLRVPAAGVRVC